MRKRKKKTEEILLISINVPQEEIQQMIEFGGLFFCFSNIY